MKPRLLFAGTVTIEARGGDSTRRLTIAAYSGDVISPLGYSEHVFDLAGLELPATIPILAQHQNAIAAMVGTGRPASDGKALTVAVVVAETPVATEVMRLLDAGHPLQASVGVEPLEMVRLEPGKKLKANGREITAGPRGLTHLRRGVLREVSILPVGADGTTSVTIAAAAAGVVPVTFDAWLISQGLDPATISDAQRTALTATYARLHPPAESPATAAELEAAFGTDARPLLTRAMTEGWNITRARAEAHTFLRARLANNVAATNPHTGGAHGAPAVPEVLCAALMVSHGFPERDVGAQFGEQVTNAAVAGPMRRLTLNGAMREICRAAGRTVSAGKFSNSDIRTTFEASRILAGGGSSTFSLPGILANLANKALLMSYDSVGVVWPRFCRVATDVQDFKPYKRYRLTVKGQFEEVAPDGAIKHGSMSEFEAGGQLKTYGQMIGVNRQDFINDDLGAFLTVPRGLGRLAAVMLERAVFKLVLSNPSNFFHGDNDNLIEAGSALSDASLRVAYQKFQEQTDDNGDPVLVAPKVLLVPPALEMTVRKLVRDTTIVATGDTDATLPGGNPWAGMFDPVPSPYLSEAIGLPGADDDSWYLTAGPGDFSPVEVAFLQGNRTPIVEQGEMDFDRLGLQVRAYHDWAVAMLEHRGAVMATGAA